MNPADRPRDPGDPASLREAEAPSALLAFTEAAPSAVLIVQDERVALANPVAASLLGEAGEPGQPITGVVPAEAWAALVQRLLARQRGVKLPVRFETRLLLRSGEGPWVELGGATLELHGRPAILLVAHDVTDRRLAEEALRESERRFRDLVETVQLVAVQLDAEGDVTFANAYLLELVGRPEEDVLGQSWFELFLPEDRREPARASFLERQRLGVAAPHDEYEIVTAAGERRWISWSTTLLRDGAGQPCGVAALGSDATERRRVEEQLVHDALHDGLTGLPNRALFLDRLSAALARLRRRPGTQFAVLLLDVDHFKVVNDSLGHAAGDQFLSALALVLASRLRSEHTLARLGGDEFAVLLEDIGDEPAVLRVAERLTDALAQPIHVADQDIFPGASIGIAFGAPAYTAAEDVLRDADTALHQAKQAGRGRHQVFDASMHSRALWRLRMENSLRRAIEREEFVLHYQPIVSLADGRVWGFEALCRWAHPERGLVSPLEFVHVAEETGLIFAIGAWTLREACRTLASWTGIVAPGLTVSVNLSGKQFAQPDLGEQVEAALAAAGLPPARLKLEVTESVIMENPEAAVALLQRLKELGTGVCIDDFGTGYSSLAYLLRLPADTLKIDRSFVTPLGERGRHRRVVETIVALGNDLGLQLVAEGVETAAQREALTAMGCGLGQGYLFSRPVPAPQALALARGGTLG